MPKYEKLQTPVGELEYPFITEPDQYGNFKVGLILDPKAEQSHKEFLGTLKGMMKEGHPHEPWSKHADPQSGDEDGRYLVKAKTKSKPRFVDAAGNPVVLEDGVKVGNGSKGRLNVSVAYYDGFGGGMNLYLNALQLIELESYDVGGGFDKVEGGFISTAAAPSEDFAEPEIRSAKETHTEDDDLPF